ncbi:hypothetical protein BX616_009804 [Lobosporangium transversale]|uniref:Uncharacterized protein n=1 Tax=Lobosporangium transversale TaxID=64571 RepID=A0A1Y2H2Z2_9FUNG|nr:hypothetical protein BCR41DRAFT_392763 [Lobosporangium transversale]XP_021885161.1 hypothetical protein BCR41DRAFT_367775 [Lobosporangium transversale]KAF9913625.1 hypothetical protein BX616_009804 [Lobosporangium transversale]ORZ27432.1 hypothetical protein BCR41DRAFT_392763 [Lobosporangium transversale]ORZ27434.1 hypothetical protein BCR41DRAFT_367775 [Lobosporangium transversale]|eukprot:XP_021885159.1 hypothetical protein BCR41DRAFT_392763 [Lobosporangium transversale]
MSAIKTLLLISALGVSAIQAICTLHIQLYQRKVNDVCVFDFPDCANFTSDNASSFGLDVIFDYPTDTPIHRQKTTFQDGQLFKAVYGKQLLGCYDYDTAATTYIRQ